RVGHVRRVARTLRLLRTHARNPVRVAGGGAVMSASAPLEPGRWEDGQLPANVRVGPNSVLTGSLAFKRFRSKRDVALAIGAHCTMAGAHFALGEKGRVEIGDYCYFTYAGLLCEMELRVGNYVVIGWDAALAGTDFRPI